MDETFVILSKDSDFQAQVDKRHRQHLEEGEPIERAEVEREMWSGLVDKVYELIGDLAAETDRMALYKPHQISHRYAELDAAKLACERFTALFKATYHVINDPSSYFGGRPYTIISESDVQENTRDGLTAEIVFTCDAVGVSHA